MTCEDKARIHYGHSSDQGCNGDLAYDFAEKVELCCCKLVHFFFIEKIWCYVIYKCKCSYHVVCCYKDNIPM